MYNKLSYPFLQKSILLKSHNGVGLNVKSYSCEIMTYVYCGIVYYPYILQQN